MVSVLFLFPGCRNYSNRRKAGSVCQCPQAQAGTGRPLLMMARSGASSSSSSSCNTHAVFIPLAFFCCCPHNMWGRKGKAWGGGGEFSILAACWTKVSFTLLIPPHRLYTLLPDASRNLGTLVAAVGGGGVCCPAQGFSAQAWNYKYCILELGESCMCGLLIGFFSFQKRKHHPCGVFFQVTEHFSGNFPGCFFGRVL